MSESFEEFRKSFSYGTRSDLSFKFLKSMGDEQAARFFQQLLESLGESYDTGELDPLIALAYEAQIGAYAPGDTPSRWVYEDRPFTPIRKPLHESRVGLLTSSGHFAAGDDPKPFGVANMTQQEAEDRISEFLREAPQLSAIPADISAADLRVRHGGYDVRSVRKDHNVAFPRDRLLDAARSGRIGEVAPTLYSFTGATAQGRVRKVASQWAQQLLDDRIDVLLLVPV